MIYVKEFNKSRLCAYSVKSKLRLNDIGLFPIKSVPFIGDGRIWDVTAILPSYFKTHEQADQMIAFKGELHSVQYK